MEERLSPSLLFTPPPSRVKDVTERPDSPARETSLPSKTRSGKASSRMSVYVSLPILSEEEKSLYKPFSENPIPDDDEFSGTALHSIIGEYKEGSRLYYFAKLTEDAQAFKVRCYLFTRLSEVI